MPKLRSRYIVEHFTSNEHGYKNRVGIIHEHDPTIINFIRERCSPNSMILEVGGGSGALLDSISRDSGIKNLINCEIVPCVYKNQANIDIQLVGGDALHLPYKSNTFDYIIIKNVFHHLIGKTRSESKDNVIVAIRELKRVSKKKGYIIILEQYNNRRFFSDMIFYICSLCANFSITIKKLEIDRSVIVSFLTPEEILSFLRDENTEIVFENKISINPAKIFKYTILMKDVGRMLVISKKR